jgi:hypothetical protein
MQKRECKIRANNLLTSCLLGFLPEHLICFWFTLVSASFALYFHVCLACTFFFQNNLARTLISFCALMKIILYIIFYSLLDNNSEGILSKKCQGSH